MSPELDWIVECRGDPLFPRWEAIAAFNCDPAAYSYMNACREGAERARCGLSYRVVKRES